MYPERDRQAEEFDAALERLRSGERPDEYDADLRDLLILAARLEQDLPRDLPDPAFRERLKRELLSGRPRFHQSQPETAPIDPAGEGWRRQITRASWRTSAVAAALVVIVIGALVLSLDRVPGVGTGQDSAPSDDSVAMPASADDPPVDEADDEQFSALEAPEAAEDQATTWLAANLPPIDGHHIVLAPLAAVGSAALTLESSYDVRLIPTTDLPDLPGSAPVYYLAAPQDPVALLSRVRDTLAIDGEIVPGNRDEGIPYRIVNQAGEPVVVWDAACAFFQFWGDLRPNAAGARAGDSGDVTERAYAWLEGIGFDLHSVEYEARVVESEGQVTVQFMPLAMPELGLDLSLGAQVTFDDDGRVRSASGFWLSLVGIEEMPVRPAEDAWEVAQAGDGFWPPLDLPTNEEILVEVREIKIVHLLTRWDEATYVLQPAIKFAGQYATRQVARTPGPARYYVPAVPDD
jgi:hypothetical protein